MSQNIPMSLLAERFNKAVSRWEKNSNEKFVGAEMARTCGFERQTVGDWKMGRTKTIKAENLFCVANYLNVDPIWLNEGKGSMINETPAEYNAINSKILASALEAVEVVIEKQHLKTPYPVKAYVLKKVYIKIQTGEITEESILLLIETAKELLDD